MRPVNRFIPITLIASCIFATACTSWERSTFQALSVSKVTFDTAQDLYEKGCPAPTGTLACIPHNVLAYNTINNAKAIQVDAEQAMFSYEKIKETKGTASALTAQQQVVSSILVKLPQLIAQIKALYTSRGAQNE